MTTQEEKHQHQWEARALLEGFWPEGFSFSAPKPLKIGITDDLVADAERRGKRRLRQEKTRNHPSVIQVHSHAWG